jgi:aryl-alcohol dehydrogenase-like predicted oxidoreductase
MILSENRFPLFGVMLYPFNLIRARARPLLKKGVDFGVMHCGTAAPYDFGRNEELVGPAMQRP